MRKSLLIAASCLTLFASCKKDAQKQPEAESNEKKIPVAFNLSGDQISFGTFSTPNSGSKVESAASAPSEITGIDKILYIVFNSDGNIVSRMQQDRNNPNKLYRIGTNTKKPMSSSNAFGTITDTLKVGTYTLLVTAAGSSSCFNYLPTNLHETNDITFDEAKFFLQGSSDAFLYKGTLNVTATTTTTPQPITLNRIVGKIELNFEDMVPATASSFVCDVSGELPYYNVKDGAPGGTPIGNRAYSFGFSITEIGKTTAKRSFVVLNTLTPMNLTLTVKDNKSQVISNKTILNVPAALNKRTIVTGKGFSDPASSSSILINSDWGADLTTIKF